MSSCIKPRPTRLIGDAAQINCTADAAAPLKRKANVKPVSYTTDSLSKSRTQVIFPESTYQKAKDRNMNYRHSLSTVSSQIENDFGATNGQQSDIRNGSPELIKRGSNDNAKQHQFPARIGDSIVSGTSLIMAGSSSVCAATHVQKKFLNGSRSMENLWIKDRDYNFENLVFEGGGSKGMAYVGALQVI